MMTGTVWPWNYPPDVHPARCSLLSGVYFVRQGDWVKIGVSSHVLSRIKHAILWNPNDLVVSWIYEPDMDAAGTLERAIHEKFALAHHRHEWYAATDGLLEFMREHSRPVPTRAELIEALKARPR